ncbi:MAG TPA: hypothetical protein VFL93_06630, partial [Longimicrobiaceae bacterium]|nr:hypothetical protein [Longimicrobiaceae bacterium]
MRLEDDGDTGFFGRSALPLPQVSMDDLQEKQARARALEEAGNADAALGLYREILAAEPERAPVYLHTAALHEASGARDEASAAYARAADLFVAAGLNHLGLVALRRLLRVDPERAETHRSFAELSAGQGFILDARQGFLQFAERAVAAGQTDVAIEALRSHLERFPADSVVRERLADLGGEPPAEAEAEREPARPAEPELPDLEIEPTSLVEQEEEAAATPAPGMEALPLEGFEPTRAGAEEEAAEDEDEDGTGAE